MNESSPFEASQAAAVAPAAVTVQLQPNKDPDSSNAATASVDNWTKASKGVMNSVALSRSLKTLRDMCSDAFIDSSSLKTMKSLGEGAFASVDLAWYTPQGGGNQYKVAVKRLKRELYGNADDLKLFAQEIELMRKLRHRNIVDFIGAGEEGENFVVQEYMSGGTVKQLVTKQMLVGGSKVYSTAEALDICLQMARGLNYLHTVKPMVIHRDLKLENVLLNVLSTPSETGSRFEAKLADFGLSRRVEVKQQQLQLRRSTSTCVSLLTSAASQDLDDMWSSKVKHESFIGNHKRPSKSLLARANAGHAFELTGRTGSLMYMAPEVFKELPYSEKADVFSFGMMMYEVMQKYVMISAVAIRGTYEELEEYAARVASGYRPPLHEHWPTSIRTVIQDESSCNLSLQSSPHVVATISDPTNRQPIILNIPEKDRLPSGTAIPLWIDTTVTSAYSKTVHSCLSFVFSPMQSLIYTHQGGSWYKLGLPGQAFTSTATAQRDCWAQDPASRPSMEQVVQRLEMAQAARDLLELDKPTCSCVIC